MREGRLAEDRTIVHDGLLSVVHGCVGLVQLVRNLIDEVVLLGDGDRSCPCQSLSLLVLLILLFGDECATDRQDAEDDGLTHPDVIGAGGMGRCDFVRGH